MVRMLQVATGAPMLAHFLSPFSRHFRRAGWTVDAAATGIGDSPTCKEAFDHVFDVSWSRNPWNVGNFRAAAAQVRRIVEEGSYDLVHVHTPVAAWITRFALRHRGRKPKVIYTAHGFHFHPGGDPVRNFLFRKLESWAARWTDYLVVINRYDESEALRLLPRDRTWYMPGIGIDRGSFRPDRVPPADVLRVREELQLPPDALLYLMVAEFIPRKAHADAIHALAAARSKQIHLAFAGSGPTESAMKELAARLGVAERTHFLGPRGDIAALMCSSRATVLPSHHEGLSRAAMESLCLGVPVIGSDVRGIRDLLEQGGGILVPFGDRARLAAAMDRLADPSFVPTPRSNLEELDLRNVLRLHEDLYRRALAN